MKKSYVWVGGGLTVMVIAVGLLMLFPRPSSVVSTDASVLERSSTTVLSGTYLLYQTIDTAADRASCHARVYRSRVGSSTSELVTERTGECYPYTLQGTVITVPGLEGSTAVGIDGAEAPMPPSGGFTRVASRDGTVSAKYELDFTAGVSTVRVYSTSGEQLATRLLDPNVLQIEGYLAPVGVSDDGEDIYLRQWVDKNWSGSPGLWIYHWRSGELVEVSYVREKKLEWDGNRAINFTTKQLIGISTGRGFPGDEIWWIPTPPSAVHVVDLVTGAGQVVREEGATSSFILDHAMLSESGKQYVVDVCGAEACLQAESGSLKGEVSERIGLPGTWKDWVGTFFVLQQEKAFLLYDHATKTETTLVTWTGIADREAVYLGHVIVE